MREIEIKERMSLRERVSAAPERADERADRKTSTNAYGVWRLVYGVTLDTTIIFFSLACGNKTEVAINKFSIG